MIAVEKSGASVVVTAEDVAGELAWCLARFLDATADENVMQRAKTSLALWHALREAEAREASRAFVHA